MAAPSLKQLPSNAYTALPPGASYEPLVPATEAPAELTPRSVGWGVFLCVIFTVASAYSGLKVGQVMEAAIPISILAIGLARVYPPPLHACWRTSSSPASAALAGSGGGRRDLHAPGALHSASSIRIRCRPSSSAWPAAAWACCS